MADPIQDQLAAARRTQILEAAAQVFAEKGFHPTTIKDIARRAGIADGTIYNYFENKTALLFGIFDLMRDSVVQQIDLPPLTELDLRAFLHTYLSYALMSLNGDQNFTLFRIVMSEILVNQEMRDLYYEKMLEQNTVIAEAQLRIWADKHPDQPIDVPMTVRILSGLVLGMIMQHILGDPIVRANWNTLPAYLTDLILKQLENNPS